jgi:hypothetical protein
MFHTGSSGLLQTSLPESRWIICNDSKIDATTTPFPVPVSCRFGPFWTANLLREFNRGLTLLLPGQVSGWLFFLFFFCFHDFF